MGRWLVNLALVLGSLVVCLLALEVVCRLIVGAGPGEAQLNDPYRQIRTIGRPRRFHPLHSYRERVPLEYDHQGYYAPTKGLVHFHADHLGARWTAPAEQPLIGRTVLVLGDSFTYGHGLHYEDTYVHQLQQSLVSEGRAFSFVNFAERGSNARRNLHNYLEVRERLEHQAVLYGLNINDLIWFPASHFITNPLAVPRITRYWKGYGLVSNRIHHWLIRRHRIGRLTSPEALDSEKFDANFDALMELQRTTATRGTPLTVALLPIMVDLDRGTLHPLYERIRRRIESRGIEVVDLTRCLDGRRDRDLWILPFDQHPNDVANRVFAEHLLPHYR